MAEAIDLPNLHARCARLGISTGYHDIWGIYIDVAPDALSALALEFESNATDSATTALPHAVVVRGDAPQWSVPLQLANDHGRLQWHLIEENGQAHHGEVDASQLNQSGQRVIEGRNICDRSLVLAIDLPVGYHRLSIEGVGGEALVIRAPAHCFSGPVGSEGGRVWGPAVQLYSLRSPRNWGIGDFSDLAQLTEQFAAQGAGIIGLNPLHALYSHNAAHASPYSPSSRLQINPLYIDVEALPEYRDCEEARARVQSPEFQKRLAMLREQELVGYIPVAQHKLEILELLFAQFCAGQLEGDGQKASGPEGQSFLDFVEVGGENLHRHALFEALQAELHAADPAVWGWPAWPQRFQSPESDAVARFASEHPLRIRFHQYLQWCARAQLDRVSSRCKALGMSVGLYLDLAVSVDRGGSDVWGHQSVFAHGATVGAPPDEFNPNGQGWGLPPLRPDRLRQSHYRFFIDTLRANMRNCGAIRIDHVMGLMRLYWIAPGRTAKDGAYVHYALDEMLAIVAVESDRQQCMVIGEDLGTVAPEMRQALASYRVLSYRLMYFEREADGRFTAPAHYASDALVSVSTHDLATLPGWWAGHDLRLRLQLDLFPNRDVFDKQLVDRGQERVRLLLAVHEAGFLSDDALAEAAGNSTLAPETVAAIHAFLATTPARVMVVQLEDMLGVSEQPNLPGTTWQQPNWRRKLPLTVQEVASDPRVAMVVAQLATIRPHSQSDLPVQESMQAVIPRATYRLQFHAGFGFDDAIAILPYLKHLGISHVYCSPIQRARPGSTHGYDVVAHDEINPELGGREGFERFCAALEQYGLGQILDMVPNHMGVLGADNAWWTDVLENGAASLYAQAFDIDWQPLNPQLAGKVLVPVLGDAYGDILQRGELVLAFEPETGSLCLNYHEHRFPLAPRTYPAVLSRASARLTDLDLAASLDSIGAAFGHLPPRELTHDEAMLERARDKEVLKGRLSRLVARQSDIAEAIAGAVTEMNLVTARDELHELIEGQAYRLAYWRVAADEINYRRFFDINELAALRMERDEVFEATHGMALDLCAAGKVDGLRIDHPDGLYDPARYFEALQAGYARRAGFVLPAPDAEGRPARPLYVVLEKIAAPHEEIPIDWHAHGTTGYRFTNVANGVLIDARSEDRFGRIWRSFTGVDDDYETIGRIGKQDIMRTALASELNVLSTELLRIAHADRSTRDYTQNALRRALSEVAACLPVYRTYIIESPSAQDERYVDWAVAQARHHTDAADTSIFAFLRHTLLGQAVVGADEALQQRVLRFAIRFQQFSSPVAAKGIEDTAFYRYFPLSSINEVGAEPSQFGMDLDSYHAASADRCLRWPHTMLATSTHDNKRSEDVRNRINVLSEMPGPWRLALRRWRRLNAGVRAVASTSLSGAQHQAPSAADEYLLYQTLLGTLPIEGLDDASAGLFADRIVRYMLKAAREAKVHTRWTNPDEAYESALEGFIRHLLTPATGGVFLDDLLPLAHTLAWYGALNSLTLTLLKYASPGVPDMYQGNELLDLSLVDPDNRRPVDYAQREQWLSGLERDAAAGGPATVQRWASDPYDGRAKLWATWQLLKLRREQPELFEKGEYEALVIEGEQATHVIAFARHHAGQTVVLVAGRLFFALDTAVADSERNLPPTWTGPRALPLGESLWTGARVRVPEAMGTKDSGFVDRLTGSRVQAQDGWLAMADVFANFPGAVLVAEDER